MTMPDFKSPLTSVNLSGEMVRSLGTLALSNEKEELAALLWGNVKGQKDPEGQEEDENETILEITGFHALPRSDKKPDRVEISPTQMVESAELAEGRGLR